MSRPDLNPSGYRATLTRMSVLLRHGEHQRFDLRRQLRRTWRRLARHWTR